MLWVREIVGWSLIGFGLYLIRIGLYMLMDAQEPKIIETAIIMFVALGVMRFGVLLVRMAIAARLCSRKD